MMNETLAYPLHYRHGQRVRSCGVAFGLLLITLALRPQGIFGRY